MAQDLDAQRLQAMQGVVKHQQMMFQAMQGAEMPEWLAKDMTMPQFKILFLLYTHGGLRMGDLANTLGKNISTATGIVDRLVEQHFIKREEAPEDRRVVIVRLTESGSELCKSFLQAGWEHTYSMLNRLNTEDLLIVERGMELMARVAMEDAQERLAVQARMSK